MSMDAYNEYVARAKREGDPIPTFSDWYEASDYGQDLPAEPDPKP